MLSDSAGDWGGVPSRTSGFDGYAGRPAYGEAAQGGRGAYGRRPAYGAGYSAGVGGRSAYGAGRTAAPESGPAIQLSKGDTVRHKAFGRGMVLSVQAMGGDALVEIAFDNVGTKRLMLKSAAAYLTKQ